MQHLPQGPLLEDLRPRLEHALSPAYRIERELGGGGMSRVFLAEEVDLGRRVVIKVLPPEMAASVNVERFRREIQLAAQLQHPHIVPLLTAGATDDLLYYVMPFIAGESLRSRLGREGELPVSEAVRILKDVLDALAHAHAQGVVHRDIKPDNVLLAGKHALVTDFGVAKAVSASAGGSSLTSLGVALGTPAYMAPEQAAADPNVDHRADLYAVGAMAYEMLAGRAPFDGLAPQAMLAAHVTQAPDPLSGHRATVPPALNDLVMRSLEKKPADRWQRADEMLPVLDAVLTPTAGGTPTGAPSGTSAPQHAGGEAMPPGRLAALLGLGGAAALGLVYLAVLQLGLPDWVLSAAIGLLIVGLPYLAATGYVERQRARMRARLTAPQPSGGFRAWLTWRRALAGAGVGFGVLGLAATGYMLMRALGIGPVGTLVASGVLAERDRLILADFDNRSADSTLGETVGELFRVDLAQSRAVTVLEPAQVAAVLQRMQRDPATPLTLDLAREIAQREGLKAILTGELFSVGSGFVVSTRLIAVGSGDVLLADRETAAGPDELVGAVDRLSGRLRERIGESLRSIRADSPLEQVTTQSTEALRLYAKADRANNMGEYQRAIALLREAVSMDSGFAMAWRKLGVIHGNAGTRDSSVAALSHAYQHRDRLTERERHQTLGSYHLTVTRDREAAVAAYRSLLDRYADDRVALNNLALVYFEQGRWADAEELIDRSLGLGNAPAATFVNAAVAKVAQGKFDAAEEALGQFEQAYPGNPSAVHQRALLAASRGRYAESDGLIRSLAPPQSGDAFWRMAVEGHLAELALVQGKLAEAQRHRANVLTVQYDLGLVPLPRDLVEAVAQADDDLWMRRDVDGALRRVDAALTRHPRGLESVRAQGEPLLELARFYALAGRAERANQVLAEYEAEVPAEVRRDQSDAQAATRAAIAMAEGRPLDAVAAYRQPRRQLEACDICDLYELGHAYQQAGMPDSAIAAFRRYVTTPWLGRLGNDAKYLALVLQQLAALYQERGDRDSALVYYTRFTELWKDADPELQAAVRDVRERMRVLAGEP